VTIPTGMTGIMHLQVHLKSRPARLSTGVTLQYVEQGQRSGVPVLLLHAYLDSWRSFERVLEHLPDRLHALAPSQRGHGDSERPRNGYGAGDLVTDLAAFMDALEVDAAVLVGSSSAADTVRRFAVEHPDRTLGLVLVGAFHTFPADAPAVRELGAEIAALTDPVEPDFVRDFVAATAGDAVPPEFLETMVAESGKVPAHVWREMFDGLLTAAPIAGTIDAPTLILWGDADPICSGDEQEALLDAIPLAELRRYPGVGHLVHWEQPERVAADIARFARR
jgi:non-heme chloroperoxidase